MWKDTRASELAVGRISSSSPPIRMHVLDKAGESGLAAERLKEQNGFSRRSLRCDRHFNEGLQSRAPACAICGFLGATKQRRAIWLASKRHRQKKGYLRQLLIWYAPKLHRSLTISSLLICRCGVWGQLGWGGLQRRQLNTSRTSTSTQKLPALHSPFHSFHPHHVCLRALSSSAQFPSSPPALILPSSLTLLLVFLFFNFLLSRPNILLRFRARLRRGAEVVQSEHSGTSGVQHWDTVGAVSFPAWGPQRGRRIARKAWQ